MHLILALYHQLAIQLRFFYPESKARGTIHGIKGTCNLVNLLIVEVYADPDRLLFMLT